MKKIFGLLALIVLVSGCVGTGGTDQRPARTVPTEGLVINTFTLDPTFANENDIVKFDIEIENVGGATANNVQAAMTGLIDSWRKPGTNNLAQLADVRVPGLDGTATAILLPPRPSENIPGDFKVSVILLSPPNLPEGVQTDFPVTLRVDYQYRTSGSIVIPTISRSLFVERSRAGQAIDSAVQVNSNDAPLKAGLGSGQVPVILNEAAVTTQSFVIEIANVGSGMPTSGTGANAKVGQIAFSITALGPSVDKLQCGTAGAVNVGQVLTIAAGDETKLRTTGKVEIPCTVTWKNDVIPGTTGTLTFATDTTYGYFLTETETIKIEGR